MKPLPRCPRFALRSLALFAAASLATATTAQQAPIAVPHGAAQQLAAPVELTPRRVLPKTTVRVLPAAERLPGDHPWHDQLVVKFVDGARVRATEDGRVRSASGVDLTPVDQVAAQHGLSFRPLIQLPEPELEGLQQRAAQRSGRAQPDLSGLHVAELAGTAAPAVDSPRALVEPALAVRVEAAGNALLALEVVEHVAVQTLGAPPPGDIAPTTPWMAWRQDYRGPDPGMDVDYQWKVGSIWYGLRGDGIRFSDCEYGWNASHEDLVDKDLNLEPGQTIASGVFTNGWEQHGTAVLGETSAVPNSYGCNGMVPEADVYTYPEWTNQQGFRRVTAITNAIADSDAGDVVLLEMQTGSGGPAEADFSVWLVVNAGSDAGVVTVGAAGNGDQNLDGGSYSSYNSWGDSGAIIVGAGSANVSHNKLSFSSYGSRVNVQGWGESVFSLGYGGFEMYGGDLNQAYTSTFSGTSSASPFIASAAVALQQCAIELTGSPLDPEDLRQVLIDTGTPQGSGGHIGPFPNIPEALSALQTPEGNDHVWTNLGGSLAGVSGEPQLRGSGTLIDDSAGALDLTGAAPNAPTILYLSFSSTPVPFKGGLLVTFPIGLDLVLVTGPGGDIPIPFTWPAGIPGDTEVNFQYVIGDGAAIQGVALSNGMRLITP